MRIAIVGEGASEPVCAHLLEASAPAASRVGVPADRMSAGPSHGAPPHRIVLFAHGSRDPAWAEPFEELRARAARALGEDHVRLAFLEFSSPALIDCAREAAEDGVPLLFVVPLFFGDGRHVRRDLPQLAREAGERHPGVAIRIAGSLTDDEGFRTALLARVLSLATEAAAGIE